MKLKVRGEFFEAEVEGSTVQEAWREAAFWHGLPSTCPVDNTPVVFGYANRGGYDYYFLESTGDKRYRFPLGQSQEEKGSLFPGEYDKSAKRTFRRWLYWDGQQEVVVWEDGRMITSEVRQPEHRDGRVDDKAAALRVFNELGASLYQNWTEIRTRNVERVSGGTTSVAADLTLEQINKLNDGLRSLAATRKDKVTR